MFTVVQSSRRPKHGDKTKHFFGYFLLKTKSNSFRNTFLPYDRGRQNMSQTAKKRKPTQPTIWIRLAAWLAGSWLLSHMPLELVQQTSGHGHQLNSSWVAQEHQIQQDQQHHTLEISKSPGSASQQLELVLNWTCEKGTIQIICPRKVSCPKMKWKILSKSSSCGWISSNAFMATAMCRLNPSRNIWW